MTWNWEEIGIQLEDEADVERRSHRSIVVGAALILVPWILFLLYAVTRPAVEPLPKPVLKPTAYVGLIEFVQPAPCAEGRKCI